MNRRTFVLILAILLLFGAAAAAYYLIVKKPAQEPETPAAVETAPELAPVLVVPETTISPVLSFNGETVWYMSLDGHLYRQPIEPQAVKEEYLLPASPAGGPAPVANPVRLVWQQQGNDFIVERSADGHTRYEYYSAAADAFVPYDAAVRAPVFLFGDKQVAYIWIAAGGKNELTAADPDGKNYKKLSELYSANYELVASPAKNELLIFSTDGTNPDDLLLVDLDTVQYTLLDEKVPYGGAKFSPDGSRAVVEKAGRLVLHDLSAGVSEDLNIAADVKKTAWKYDSSELIAVDSGEIKSYDVIAKTWRSVYSFPAGSSLSPAEIFLHPVKNTLLFTDSATAYLYRLDLE